MTECLQRSVKSTRHGLISGKCLPPTALAATAVTALVLIHGLLMVSFRLTVTRSSVTTPIPMGLGFLEAAYARAFVSNCDRS